MRSLYLIALLIAPAAHATLRGTWAGNVSVRVRCDNNSTIQVNGSVTAWFLDFDDGTFNAAMLVRSSFPDLERCQFISTDSMTMMFVGMATASSITGNMSVPGQSFEMKGSISDDTIKLTGENDFEDPATVDLTRNSSRLPDVQFGGWYPIGTYSLQADYSQRCNNLGVLSATGSADATVLQIGEAGLIILSLSSVPLVVNNGTGGCIRTDEAASLTLYTRFRGTALDGFVRRRESREVFTFTASVNVTMISGTVAMPGGGLTFNVRKAPVEPSVKVTLRADPSTIRRGGS